MRAEWKGSRRGHVIKGFGSGFLVWFNQAPPTDSVFLAEVTGEPDRL